MILRSLERDRECTAGQGRRSMNLTHRPSFIHWNMSALRQKRTLFTVPIYLSSIADNLAVLRLFVGDSRSGKKRRIERGMTARVPPVQKFNPESWWLAGCKGQAYDAKVVEGPTMSDAKQPSKRRRRSKTLPVLGAAGLWLSLASTASAVPGGPAVDLAKRRLRRLRLR